MAKPTPLSSNRIVEERLDECLSAIQKEMRSDCMMLLAPLYPGIDDLVRRATEDQKKRNKNLVVILETSGGYIEVAKRIGDTLHHHYKRVEYIVPNYAMSAGTVLVMSGDAIHMDYYSVLGPIDPQVKRPGSNRSVPALGYLKQYERLIQKSSDGKLTEAELAYLLAKFDMAELYQFEEERNRSIELLKEWLVKYKFKDWKITQRRRIKVTKKIRENRAREIASVLNDTDRWHTHGAGINIRVVQKTLKLKVENFGLRPALNALIKQYYNLLEDYMNRRAQDVVLHIVGAYVGLATQRG